MKILWFSNTTANAESYFGRKVIYGGWMQALNKKLEDKVDLHVAFFNPKGPKVFKYSKTSYYSIIPKYRKVRKVLRLLFNIEKERDYTDLYLKIIDKVKPDLIHIHGTNIGFISIIEKVKIPVLVSLQGIHIVYYHKFNAGFSDKILKRTYDYKNLFFQLLSLTLYDKKKLFQKKAIREYNYISKIKHIAGRTEWDKRVADIISPGAEYFHIDEILREPFYKHKWKEVKGNNLRVFTITTNSPYKGFETLCEALNQLERLQINIKWFVAGLTEKDSIVKAAKKKLKDKYPKKGLYLLGRLNSDELITYMLKSNVYATASHIENSPNNLCEAMILGMPCIATFAGGTGSLLKDGKEGILIQDGDPWSLAGAILELFRNKKKAKLLGYNARKKATKRHCKDKIMKCILSSYKIILAQQENQNKKYC